MKIIYDFVTVNKNVVKEKQEKKLNFRASPSKFEFNHLATLMMKNHRPAESSESTVHNFWRDVGEVPLFFFLVDN